MSAQQPEQRGQILLVEDEDFLREDVGTLLRFNGYDVLEANNGDRALELFIAQHAAIAGVVCDLDMPGNSGFSLLEHFRAQEPNLRVVVATGYVSTADAARLKTMGVDAILMKPYTTDSLLQALRAAD